jgi:DNA-binding PadR family transcriptional regulator
MLLAQLLYITLDIKCDIFGDTVFENSSRLLRRLLRHTASVPKGFLRYHVLKLLREKPMSGSEIMETIEKATDGRWKPSPGSVYPLLAWLQDNGYTKEIPTEESGIKRYMLTEKGENFFEEQTKFKEKLLKRLEFLAPPFLSGHWFSAHPDKLREIREPERRFVRALFNLRRMLEKNLTEQAVMEVANFLDSAAEKMEEISSRLKEGRLEQN